MRNGTKYLRMASVLQILLGAASILLTHYLVGGDASVAGISAPDGLLYLMLAYGMGAFQIVAGIIGLMNANKKSLLAVILGVLLFLPQLAHFFSIKGNIGLILINIVALAIPYFYLHSAYKNFREK